MKKILIKKFGSLKGIKSIEIGSGSGMYSLLLASEGADVTILDYSKKAIKASKLLFSQNNQKGKFIEEDAFNLDKSLLSKFDLSMSFGTAEHFSEEKRLNFIKIHFEVLSKGGITFISVPNKWNFSYRLHKFLSETFGKWNFGEEYPFSKREFKKIGKILNQKFFFIGHSIFSDPFLISSRIRKLFKIKKDFETKHQKKQIGTFLDKYFASITAISEK